MFLTRTVHIGLLTLLLVQVSLESQISKQPTLAITGVTVIDVEAGRERADQIVIVVDNRIATIGDSSATPMPAGARQIDGRGKFIIPGLIDTHIHLGNAADRDQLRAIGPLWRTALPAFVMPALEGRTRGSLLSAIVWHAANCWRRVCMYPA